MRPSKRSALVSIKEDISLQYFYIINLSLFNTQEMSKKRNKINANTAV